MTTTAVNLPLYRVLKALNVSDADAEAAAQTASPDLSRLATKEDLTRFATKEDLNRFATKEDLARFATKDELRAEIAGVRGELAVLRSEVKAEIAGVRADVAGAIQRQTTWLFGALVAAVGVIVAVQRLLPPPVPADAARPVQAQPGATAPPRAMPQP